MRQDVVEFFNDEVSHQEVRWGLHEGGAGGGGGSGRLVFTARAAAHSHTPLTCLPARPPPLHARTQGGIHVGRL